MIKMCQKCGKEFKTMHKKQKFCSRSCCKEFYNEKILVKCSFCGKEFYVHKYRKKTVKFCSVECKNLQMKNAKSKKLGRHFKENKYILKDNHAEILINSKYGVLKALIDINDVDLCKKHYWTCNYQKTGDSFYIKTSINNKVIRLHRFITNCPKNLVVDHINHNTLDNRKANLKVCTRFENSTNVSTNKSGVCGVIYTGHNSWNAYIHLKDKKINLGTFKTKQEAINARKNAEKEKSAN